MHVYISSKLSDTNTLLQSLLLSIVLVGPKRFPVARSTKSQSSRGTSCIAHQSNQFFLQSRLEQIIQIREVFIQMRHWATFGRTRVRPCQQWMGSQTQKPRESWQGFLNCITPDWLYSSLVKAERNFVVHITYLPLWGNKYVIDRQSKKRSWRFWNVPKMIFISPRGRLLSLIERQ